MIVNAAEFLAAVRPGMSISELDRLVDLPTRKTLLTELQIGRSKVGYIQWDGQGRIEWISYLAQFPPNIQVEGLHIGMSKSAMLLRYPGLVEKPLSEGGSKNTWAHEYEGGINASGVEISARVREDRVAAFDLARPGYGAAKKEQAALAAARAADLRRKQERAKAWKNIADPDAMLRDWAAHCEDFAGTARYMAYAEWLISRRDPDDWHRAATHWNWGYGTAPLLWIIRQPRCDRATALHIFYVGEQDYFTEFNWNRDLVPRISLEVFDLINEIRQRFQQGFYQRAEIAFDEMHTLPDGYVPAVMQAPTEGRFVPDTIRFGDGMPMEI